MADYRVVKVGPQPLEVSDKEELCMLSRGMFQYVNYLKRDQEEFVEEYGCENPILVEKIEKATKLQQRVEAAFKNSLKA